MRLLVLLFLILPLQLAHAQDVSPCGVGTDDFDCDGTPDISDLCPNDSFNDSPGICGCGFIEYDVNGDNAFECVPSCVINPFDPQNGYCQCPIINVIAQSLGQASLCVSFPPITSSTRLRVPPSVTVFADDTGSSVVQLYFQRFSTFSVPVSSALHHTVAAREVSVAAARARVKSKKYAVRYEAFITKQGEQKPYAKRVSKKNELTIKGLPAGNYSAKYRVQGVDRAGKVVAKSKFSPSSDFVVGTGTDF